MPGTSYLGDNVEGNILCPIWDAYDARDDARDDTRMTVGCAPTLWYAKCWSRITASIQDLSSHYSQW